MVCNWHLSLLVSRTDHSKELASRFLNSSKIIDLGSALHSVFRVAIESRRDYVDPGGAQIVEI